VARSGRITQTNLVGSIYERLYKARNAFLHGNPVTVETLKLERSGKQVHWFAAPLFRFALTAFLEQRFSEKLSETAGGKERERHEAQGKRVRSAQRLSEDAILVADQLPRESPTPGTA
jgi:hypothetical protein